MREPTRMRLISLCIMAAFALIPTGVALGFIYDDERWFAVAAMALIFFMAG